MKKQISELERYIQELPRLFIAHSDAVGRYTQIIVNELCRLACSENFPYPKPSMPDQAYLIGRYHDIGKTGISNVLWENSSRFSDAEYKLAQTHTVLGAHFVKPKLSLTDLLNDSDIQNIIAECCLFHHERWDGTGYPFRLKGEQIPLYARIVAIADCYDAMTEDRPYKEKLTEEAALTEIRQQKGKQFDPVLADIFCEAVLCKPCDKNEV